jgi:Flp pilus assembly protein protease CpaA
MNINKIWIIGLLLVFIVEILVSISDIESGLVSQSFILMLIAIFALVVAYEYLSDSLEKSLKANK